ncbi:MAG: nucleotidyltransferase domain-containing protein [Fusobacteria bacterium]|nr:nucleotidyltransferase domain-containing protein [Fusobacteriota bacterium]
MFGLEAEDIETIKKVLYKFPEVEKAFVFGSRALGNYKKGSDVDIALIAKDDIAESVTRISYKLNEESYLPYYFDIVEYRAIENTELKQHIDEHGIRII